VRALAAVLLLSALPAFASDPLTVLWPRIIPRSEVDPSAELAASVQARLVEVARRVFPGRELDVRPKGERSCPEGGCKGGSLGVLLLKSGSSGCALVFLIGKPLRAPIKLVPWLGKLDLKKDEVGFRDPPESQVTIRDYAACEDVAKAAAAPVADAERTLRDSAK
jgi:hypothetical protein